MGVVCYYWIIKNQMGNICNGSHDRQDPKDSIETLTKNFPFGQFMLKNNFSIDIVLGTYRYHKGELLLVIAQEEYLDYSTELRDYSQNFSAVSEAVTVDRKKIINVPTSRNCPSKRLQLCVLPAYCTQNRQSYIQQFESMIWETIGISNDLTLQISHTSEHTNGIPNQTLMSAFFHKVIPQVSKPLKLTILSTETKLLNMIRFELIKTGQIGRTPSKPKTVTDPNNSQS